MTDYDLEDEYMEQCKHKQTMTVSVICGAVVELIEEGLTTTSANAITVQMTIDEKPWAALLFDICDWLATHHLLWSRIHHILLKFHDRYGYYEISPAIGD